MRAAVPLDLGLPVTLQRQYRPPVYPSRMAAHVLVGDIRLQDGRGTRASSLAWDEEAEKVVHAIVDRLTPPPYDR